MFKNHFYSAFGCCQTFKRFNYDLACNMPENGTENFLIYGTWEDKIPDNRVNSVQFLQHACFIISGNSGEHLWCTLDLSSLNEFYSVCSLCEGNRNNDLMRIICVLDNPMEDKCYLLSIFECVKFTKFAFFLCESKSSPNN